MSFFSARATSLPSGWNVTNSLSLENFPLADMGYISPKFMDTFGPDLKGGTGLLAPLDYTGSRQRAGVSEEPNSFVSKPPTQNQWETLEQRLQGAGFWRGHQSRLEIGDWLDVVRIGRPGSEERSAFDWRWMSSRFERGDQRYIHFNLRLADPTTEAHSALNLFKDVGTSIHFTEEGDRVSRSYFRRGLGHSTEASSHYDKTTPSSRSALYRSRLPLSAANHIRTAAMREIPLLDNLVEHANTSNIDQTLNLAVIEAIYFGMMYVYASDAAPSTFSLAFEDNSGSGLTTKNISVTFHDEKNGMATIRVGEATVELNLLRRFGQSRASKIIAAQIRDITARERDTTFRLISRTNGIEEFAINVDSPTKFSTTFMNSGRMTNPFALNVSSAMETALDQVFTRVEEELIAITRRARELEEVAQSPGGVFKM